MTSTAVGATDNPFAMTQVSVDTIQLAGMEGRCGEGKCGSSERPNDNEGSQSSPPRDMSKASESDVPTDQPNFSLDVQRFDDKRDEDLNTETNEK